ncbi:MAG: AMP-binding protein, partial [Planctomycetes bacterium]|nr:AMP-binding protein [Planctomycetota bacterium]
MVNVADILSSVAKCHPEKSAVVVQGSGETDRACITFEKLDERIHRCAHGLSDLGIGVGTKTILMVKPGIDFFVLTFALFRIGAVPVLIDPGMGRKQLIRCLEAIEAEAFIGIPLAHVARLLFAKSFRSVRICVTVGRRWFWGGATLRDVLSETCGPFVTAATDGKDLAAILFTSGSTGPAKGVAYEHGMFAAQVGYLASQFGCGPADTDVATFPLFALFDVALGMTAIIPDMDPSKPGSVDPMRIIAAIKSHDATQIFGSPALLNRVIAHCESSNIKLPSLRRVLTAGAPIQPEMLAKLRRVLHPEAEIHTPYGATEALPVTSIESRMVLETTAEQTADGAGICVGKVMPGLELRIIEICDQPIEDASGCNVLGVGEIGEICVRGPVVTASYYKNPKATHLAKIAEGDTLWHRMGDVGYLDESGRLWFCGRKAHRVETYSGTLFTIPCEAIFNCHPKVRRSALVGIGDAPKQKPVLCIELVEADSVDRGVLTADLLALGQKNEKTCDICTILFHPSFPVDVR